jgi:hypothetical protein
VLAAVAVGVLLTSCQVPPGNPDGHEPVPAQDQAVDTSHPTHVIGDGTPASCTSDAVVNTIALGGIITFDCGPNPITITLTATAKVSNLASQDVVIDGGGLVTLSGANQRRILYMNTCDAAQGIAPGTGPDCTNQDHPRLVVQNLTFTQGNSIGQVAAAGGGSGGGAIFVRGGEFRIVSSRFTKNVCESTGQDLGGGAVRVLTQYNSQPVYVVNSTFGGASGDGNSCSNGAALSSVWTSWVVLNSLFSYNTATGVGGNPARSGTPGGGNGGAIYNDGKTMTLTVAGSLLENNHANETGGGIFFVSNDNTGTMTIQDSTLQNNPADGFQQPQTPGVLYFGDGPPTIINSTLS